MKDNSNDPQKYTYRASEEEGRTGENGRDTGPLPPADRDNGHPRASGPASPAGGVKRKKKTALFNILLVVCICGMVVAIIMLITIFRRYQVASNEYDGLQQSYAATEENGPRFIDLAALKTINPECIGWIEIPGTGIDYPLMQGPDNVKYLEVTFEGTWNPSGAIYLDAGNTPDFAMANSLIYGHHMKDGSMFAGIASFMKEDYRKAHNEILIYTEQGIRHYEVFGAMQVSETDTPMNIFFDTPEVEAAFLAEMSNDALTLAPEDRIITLVTCVNSYDSSDQRYIVQAVFRSMEDMPAPPASSTAGGDGGSSAAG